MTFVGLAIVPYVLVATYIAEDKTGTFKWRQALAYLLIEGGSVAYAYIHLEELLAWVEPGLSHTQEQASRPSIVNECEPSNCQKSVMG